MCVCIYSFETIQYNNALLQVIVLLPVGAVKTHKENFLFSPRQFENSIRTLSTTALSRVWIIPVFFFFLYIQERALANLFTG